MDRRRAGAQFEESYAARDIDQAVKGAYPPQYARGSAIAAAQVCTTCPQGIWRVVTHITHLTSSTACRIIFTITRNAAVYELAVGAQIMYHNPCPIVLEPGDVLGCYDYMATAGATIIYGIAYIDIPIPGGGEPCFKPGRRG